MLGEGSAWSRSLAKVRDADIKQSQTRIRGRDDRLPLGRLGTGTGSGMRLGLELLSSSNQGWSGGGSGLQLACRMVLASTPFPQLRLKVQPLSRLA